MDPNTVILQGVVSLEEANGVIHKVRASFAQKASGERFERVLEYKDFLKFSGALLSISLFKKRGYKPSKGSDEDSEEEKLQDKKKESTKGTTSTTRRSKRINEKIGEKEENTNPKANRNPKLPVDYGK